MRGGAAALPADGDGDPADDDDEDDDAYEDHDDGRDKGPLRRFIDWFNKQ